MMTTLNFPPHWIEALGMTVLHSLWQGAAIAILCAIVLAFIPRKKANMRYLLAAAGLVAMVIWSGATLVDMISTHVFSNTSGLNASGATLGATEGNIAASALPWVTEFKLAMQGHISWIGWLWVLGVVIFMVRWTGSMVYLRQLKRQKVTIGVGKLRHRLLDLATKMGIDRPLEIGILQSLQSPMVIGHFKPLILVPASMLTGLSPQQIDGILAHELAHIKRHDYLVNLIQSTVEILFFYHPAYWWMGGILRDERENCCDDVAVTVCGDAFQYAKALTTLETFQTPPELAVGFQGRKQYLLGRIKRILKPERLEQHFSIRLVAILLVIFSMGSIAWFSPEENPSMGQEEIHETTTVVQPDAVTLLESAVMALPTVVDTPPPPPKAPLVFPSEPPVAPEKPAAPEKTIYEEPEAPETPESPVVIGVYNTEREVPDFVNPEEINPELMEVIQKQHLELEALHKEMEILHLELKKQHESGELEEMKVHHEAMEKSHKEIQKLHLEMEKERATKVQEMHKLERELHEKARAVEKKQRKANIERREMREVKRAVAIDRERVREDMELARRDLERARTREERAHQEAHREELRAREMEVRHRDDSKKAKDEFLDAGLIKNKDQQVKIHLENGELTFNGKKVSGETEKEIRRIVSKYWNISAEKGKGNNKTTIVF